MNARGVLGGGLLIASSSLAFSQALQINLKSVQNILPIEEHRNCSVILRNTHRDLREKALKLPTKDLVLFYDEVNGMIPKYDVLLFRRIDAREITESQWKQLVANTSKDIQDYLPTENYKQSQMCIDKYYRNEKIFIGSPSQIAVKNDTLVCRGQRTTNFGLPPQSEACDVSITQPSSETAFIKYRPSNGSGSCTLGYIRGNNPQSPNVKTEGNWDIVRFSSREETMSYGMGMGVDRSSFQTEGSNITFRRFNYQTNNRLNWTITLSYNSATKAIALTHIYNNGKGTDLINYFNGKCDTK